MKSVEKKETHAAVPQGGMKSRREKRRNHLSAGRSLATGAKPTTALMGGGAPAAAAAAAFTVADRWRADELGNEEGEEQKHTKIKGGQS